MILQLDLRSTWTSDLSSESVCEREREGDVCGSREEQALDHALYLIYKCYIR